ncbi:hypothetical protein [Legionella jordanis]|uniref:IncA protein n=1 Tax=Legionella jordanis TaxID=456 RepID=A0A0W0VE42_9GAMM|nr:hypothetical protein [Legionella jordanis]KTD18419.1 hypothetical protein Ljor_2725 [Legionella jordanis]RMX05325.1 hypothetical protein EAW55_01290 [Legionella jordanis]RMX20824.1 hypothetical protein EAS68_05755 [Legionella jordanis]VEH13232.1 Uncharacterised protein [Legionella jordanis]
MAQTLNQEIHLFNQAALKQELTAALIIEDQLEAITNDVVDANPSEAAKELQVKILSSAQQSITQMLQADSREAFLLHQHRLQHLLNQIKSELNLNDQLDEALEDYRFYHHIHQFLTKADTVNTSLMNVNLPEWFKKHPFYPKWKVELDFLSEETNPRIFDTHRKLLLEELVVNESYENLATTASMALIEQNMRLLNGARLSYLKEKSNRNELLKDIAWITLGVVLVSSAAVLGLAFPPLIVPGIIIGTLVLGYGALDFAKESKSLYSTMQGQHLGEREPSKSTLNELTELERQLRGPQSNFINRQQLQNRNWSKEEKWVKGAGYASSAAGFILAAAALSLVFPGLGVPLAAIATVFLLSVAVAVIAAGLLSFRIVKERKAINELQEQLKAETVGDDKLLEQLKTIQPEIQLSSTAKVLKEEQLHQKDVVKRTSPVSPDLDDEEEEGDNPRGREEEGENPISLEGERNEVEEETIPEDDSKEGDEDEERNRV